MNGEDLQQLSMEQFPPRRNIVGEDPNRRVHRPQADTIPEAFHFGPFRVAPHARLLERDGSPVSVSSRGFDLLCLLVSRPGEIVSKTELMARTWPDVTVEESSLRFHVTQLRRALGDSPHGSERYVVNVPGRGYCFVAQVSRQALLLKQ